MKEVFEGFVVIEEGEYYLVEKIEEIETKFYGLHVKKTSGEAYFFEHTLSKCYSKKVRITIELLEE